MCVVLAAIGDKDAITADAEQEGCCCCKHAKKKHRRDLTGMELNSHGNPRLTGRWHKTILQDIGIATISTCVALGMVVCVRRPPPPALRASGAGGFSDRRRLPRRLPLGRTSRPCTWCTQPDPPDDLTPNFWIFCFVQHPIFFCFASLYVFEYLKHGCWARLSIITSGGGVFIFTYYTVLCMGCWQCGHSERAGLDIIPARAHPTRRV